VGVNVHLATAAAKSLEARARKCGAARSWQMW
jgi:hypothetical protein